MSVLLGRQIKERLAAGDERRLVITPLLEPGEQMADQAGGVDVRLGTTFIVGKRTILTAVDPMGLLDAGALEERAESQSGRRARQFEAAHDRVYVPVGKPFVLHPHQYVLGSTLEYVALPGDLSGQVIGRSSWGRLGLVIATATVVHPGFAGVITLEITNLGDVPMVVCPGVRIGQLVFFTVEGAEARGGARGRYRLDTEPTLTRVFRDREFARLRSLR